MTMIGKICIVLILFMSCVFMSFAVAVYATHTNWKEQEGAVSSQLQTLKDQNTQIENEKDELQNRLAFERAARREALANLEQQRLQLAQDLETRNTQYNTILTEHNTAISSVDLYQKQLEDLKQENRDLRTNINAAQQDRDDQFKRVRTLTNQVNELEGVRANLERRYNSLEQNYAQAMNVLKVHGMDLTTPLDGIPPELTASVKEARRNFIRISVGSDDGIRPGHIVEISRRNRYLGQAQVTSVRPDEAAAKLLKEIAPIQEGDRVQTKIR